MTNTFSMVTAKTQLAFPTSQSLLSQQSKISYRHILPPLKCEVNCQFNFISHFHSVLHRITHTILYLNEGKFPKGVKPVDLQPDE